MFKPAKAILAFLLIAIASAQTVTVGLFQDPPNLDPALSTATSEYVVLSQIYDTLLTFDESGGVVPSLAKSWQISDDGLKYSFELRDDVTFHDGTPFNAEAMKFSLERTINMPAGAFVEQLGKVEAVDVTGEYSLDITLTEPQGAFLTYMADRSSSAVAPSAASGLNTAPVGTGPFKFVDRIQQDRITLAANEAYWDGSPNVDNIVFRFFPDGSVRYANLRSGAVDIIYPIESKDYVTAQGDPSINLITEVTNGWRIVVLNTTKPPFDNVHMRRALSAALDQVAINQIVFNGLESPATSLFPSSSPYFVESSASVNADPQAAKDAISASGVAAPRAILTTIARSPEDQLSQLIQAMASQGGLELDIQQVEVGEYQRRYSSSEFEVLTMQWSGQADPGANITSFLITDGFWNWSGYSNPEVDRLLVEAEGISDVAQRRELYGQVMDFVNNDVPLIPLVNQVRLIATGSDISGVQLQANTGILVLKDVAVAE